VFSRLPQPLQQIGLSPSAEKPESGKACVLVSGSFSIVSSGKILLEEQYLHSWAMYTKATCCWDLVYCVIVAVKKHLYPRLLHKHMLLWCHGLSGCDWLPKNCWLHSIVANFFHLSECGAPVFSSLFCFHRSSYWI